MDDAGREAAMDNVARNLNAVPDSIEIVRQRREGDRATALARWTDAQTGQRRRGAVEVVMADGLWRAKGGWSSSADHDSDHPVWRAWGGNALSTSGWVSDQAGATIRIRNPDGRVEVDTVENGVAILIYDTVFDRTTMVEVLDDKGNVMHTVPLHPA